MKGYEYNGNLQEDLKKLKKKFDIKRFLGFEIIFLFVCANIAFILTK